MNDLIKIDGHIFVSNYVERKDVKLIFSIADNTYFKDEGATYSICIGSICNKCSYAVNLCLSDIKEYGVGLIISDIEYLPCDQYMIKTLLE